MTYLAQVRQLHFKNDWLLLLHVPTMHPFLLIKQSKKLGMSHKEIATIGIARVVAWEGQNKSTDVWLRVAGNWLHSTHCFLSLSHAKERK